MDLLDDPRRKNVEVIAATYNCLKASRVTHHVGTRASSQSFDPQCPFSNLAGTIGERSKDGLGDISRHSHE